LYFEKLQSVTHVQEYLQVEVIDTSLCKTVRLVSKHTCISNDFHVMRLWFSLLNSP